MRINAPRFLADLDTLAEFGAEGEGVTRITYGAMDMQARDWVDAQLRAPGCEVRRDAGGNSIARLPGIQPGLKAIALGSHTDTVPHGGRFDGALGVLACARAVGNRLRHPLMDGALTLTVNKPAAPCDAQLMRAITDACARLNLSALPMPSGAFHDAANMAALCPQAMIFVPSPNGVSHSPLEYTPPDDRVNGANALLNTLLILDEQLD